ncbi:MAG: Flp family type IVb pilin [Xanthobacteraceae bacterium]
MRATLRRFVRDQSGATAIEYAMIAGGIAIVIAAAVQALGSTTAGKYQSVQDALQQQGQ